jgi:hypothetical protein
LLLLLLVVVFVVFVVVVVVVVVVGDLDIPLKNAARYFRNAALQNRHFSNANQHLIIETQYFSNAVFLSLYTQGFLTEQTFQSCFGVKQLKKVIYGLSLHSSVFYPATLVTLSLGFLSIAKQQLLL